MHIAQPLTLPCGATVKNRIAKAAMSENMAEANHFPNKKYAKLYQTWAKGGLGICISGNVMIDSSALGEPRNVVIEKGLNNHRELKAWAKAGTKKGTHLWVQLNHPGKQSPKFLSKTPVAPSAIAFDAPMDKMFNRPRALSLDEIKDIVERFGYAAKVCREVGFTGVQIHGAHGYLISQFLSPKHNQRQDQYGGSLENRMRLVAEIYQSIRSNVGADFPVSLKINSADFQKGGFSQADAIKVIETLGQMGVDLIEISGGTYEAPTMTGSRQKASTKKREAYFLDFVAKVRPLVKCPLMLTGGFRDPKFMEETLKNKELDVIGLARALAVDPDFPNRILKGETAKSLVRPVRSRFKLLNAIFTPEITWYTNQLHRMGNGKAPKPDANVHCSMLSYGLKLGISGLTRIR